MHCSPVGVATTHERPHKHENYAYGEQRGGCAHENLKSPQKHHSGVTRRRWSLLKSKANATKPRKHTAPKKKPRLIRRSSTCLTPYVIRQSSSSIRTKTVPRALIKIMLQINVTTSKLNLRDNAVFKSMVQLNEAVKAALASCTIGGMSLYTSL